MSLTKCRKYLRETEGFDSDLHQKRKTPIFLSDSKASYLKSLVHSEIENEIVWWFRAGWNSSAAAEYLRWNIDAAIRAHGSIHLYVWIGTCNLTVKVNSNSGYIKLNTQNACAKLTEDLEFIAYLARWKNFSVTFLELPVYSIKHWNAAKGHPNPEIFSPDDQILQTRIKLAIQHISRLNRSNSANIVWFNVDLLTSRKKKGKPSKPYFYFNLYRDGIHPSVDLSGVWLRKVTQLVLKDCH